MPDIARTRARAASTTARRTGGEPELAASSPRSAAARDRYRISATRIYREIFAELVGAGASRPRVGERRQRQQQHPEDDRAPDQADDAAAGGPAAAARARRRALRPQPSLGSAPRLRRSWSDRASRPVPTPPPSCTPTAPAAAARMTPSFACFQRRASRRQHVDCLFEVADHREAERGQARRHVVDQAGTGAATAPSAAR